MAKEKSRVELQQLDLPDLSPGAETSLDLKFTQSSTPLVIRFCVLRPTGFAAQSLDWKP
jgi:hypothetical protein